MGQYTREEFEEALRVVASAISRCERAQPRFAEGTAQHTLLGNRIKALRIAEALIAGEPVADRYTSEELTEAVRPVSSIISKCEKARLGLPEGAAHHTRLKNMIKAMQVSRSLMTDEIGRRG